MVNTSLTKTPSNLLLILILLVSHRAVIASSKRNEELPSFDKLPFTYTISYGEKSAPIHITEYFSFSCPKCLEFIRKDFPAIQSAYIDTGKVYWTFHPDPADILTLQGMVCFELLKESEKQGLLEMLSKEIRGCRVKQACFKLQEKMKALGRPLSRLHDLSYLEKTEAFRMAFSYLKQPNVPAELPTIEINGALYQEFPSMEWIHQTLMDLQTLTITGRSK